MNTTNTSATAGAISMKDILESMKSLGDLAHYVSDDPYRLAGRPRSLCGLGIVEAPSRYEPVLKLRQDAPVTDGFRAEFDAWLVEMFGTRDVSPIPAGTAYLFNNTLLMRREDVARISIGA